LEEAFSSSLEFYDGYFLQNSCEVLMVHFDLKFYFFGFASFPRVSMDLRMLQRWSSHHCCGSGLGMKCRLLAGVFGTTDYECSSSSTFHGWSMGLILDAFEG